MSVQIWKDYEVTLGTSDYVDYTIRTSTSATDTIYSGRAFKKPNEANVKVIINDICADYMGQQLPNLAPLNSGIQACDTYIKTFYVYAGSTQKAAVEFLYDYSYDYDLADGAFPYSMADPIDGILDFRMPLVRTMRMGTATMHYYNTIHSFNDDFNDDFQNLNDVSTSLSGLGNFVLKADVDNLGKSVTIQESSGWTHYRFEETCAKYALYYVNELGGWDSLVMRGGFKRTDKYKRYQMKRSYNNAVSTNRGTVDYANEVSIDYELRTAWLTDEQAGRMHHLLGSNMVYMYDLDTDMVYPVNIVDKSCEYKTYKNNGCKMVQYAIGVEIAKDQTRR